MDNALEQYRAEKDAKGEPLSREEMQQIEAQYADPDVSAEEEYDELWIKLWLHPKLESTRHGRKPRKKKFDEKWAMPRLS